MTNSSKNQLCRPTSFEREVVVKNMLNLWITFFFFLNTLFKKHDLFLTDDVNVHF